jgi:hypothetical protein
MTDGCAAEPQWPGPGPAREKAGDASRGTDEEVDGRLQKYTLLIINEPAIDQLSLLKVNTITDSQVQCAAAHLKGDRNSDEGSTPHLQEDMLISCLSLAPSQSS